MKSVNLLYFVFGAAVGSVITYYLTKEKIEKQAQEDINEIRKSMRDEYKETITNAITDAVDNLNELSEQKQEADLFREYDPHKTDYQKYDSVRVKGHDSAAVIVENVDSEEAAKESPREEVPELPYIISSDDFANTMRFHDKVTLGYYDDGALVNEDDDSVELDMVGIDNLTQFRTGRTDDPEWMYVRNERIGVDFEIERIHCNYGDDSVDGS